MNFSNSNDKLSVDLWNKDVRKINQEDSNEAFRWYKNFKTGRKAFGRIAFKGDSQQFAHFALLDQNSKMSRVYNELLLKHWSIPRPTLLISVTGSAHMIKGIQGSLLDAFRRGLYESAAHTGAWIVSGGLNVGVMKEVGKARRQYSSAYSDSVPVIGIMNMNEIQGKQQLDIDLRSYKPIEVNRSKTVQTEKGQDLGNALDPNHKFMLAVDGEDKGEKLDSWSTFEFRRAFGTYINAEGGGPGSKNVQTVSVVFNGKIGTLLAVKEMLCESIPCVIVAGSGGVADLIRLGIEFLVEKGARDESVLNSELEMNEVYRALEKIDSQKVHEWLRKIDIKTKDSEETRQWEENLQIVLSQQDLIEVFYHNHRSTRLEHSILGALMNNLQKDDLVQQIKLCMRLNQIELAQDRIAKSTEIIKDSDANELMMEALLGNRVDFVKLLVDSSYVNISDFMTNKNLVELYIKGLEQDFSSAGGRSFFYQLCLKKNIVGEDSEKFTRWIKSLTEFPRNNGLSSIKKMPEIPRRLVLYEHLAYCERKLLGKAWSSVYERRAAEYSILEDQCLDPFRDIFLWCLIFKRVEMARIIWANSSEGLTFALAASVLSKMASKLDDRDTDVVQRYTRESKEYEQLAVDVFLESYKNDRGKSYKLLSRVQPSWGNSTCLELAVSGKCRDFVALVGVQELLSMIWRGNIHLDQPYRQVLICLGLPFLPFLPARLITFDITAKDNRISWRRKFLWTFQAPFSVFVYNVVFFFVYLFIFASVILSRFCYNPHWLELVLIAWTGTLLIEEARQVSWLSLERNI